MRTIPDWPWHLVIFIGCWAYACVNPVTLENTPCPCSEGYTCCSTSGKCLANGSTCPDIISPPSVSTTNDNGQKILLPSSQTPCSYDNECPTEEGCHSWTTGAAENQKVEVQGPRQCRRRCRADLTCVEKEYCQLAPTNGVLLQSLELKPLCLAQNVDPNCPGWSCQNCPLDQMARTFCQGTELHGCLISIHPLCGLTCKKTKLADCVPYCQEKNGTITCPLPKPGPGDTPITFCDLYPCSACPQQLSYCADKMLRTCLRAPNPNNNLCKELCLPVDVTFCANGCTSDPNGLGAQCNP